MKTRRTALHRACELIKIFTIEISNEARIYSFRELVIQPNERIWRYMTPGKQTLEGGAFRDGLTKKECLSKIRFLIGIVEAKERMETKRQIEKSQRKLF